MRVPLMATATKPRSQTKPSRLQLVPPKRSVQELSLRITPTLHLPGWVRDLATFRRWAKSDDFPKEGRFAYLGNALWMDLSMEQLYLHNQIKGKLTAVLMPLVEDAGLGRYIPDGMLLTNTEAGLTTIPDGLFVSYDTLRKGGIREISSAHGGCVELEGTPDLAIEVVSVSSADKDLEELPGLYWWANIPEYWVFDARTDEVTFELLKHGSKGYTKTKRTAGGWLKSDVLSKSFRLVQREDPLGKPLYALEVK